MEFHHLSLSLAAVFNATPLELIMSMKLRISLVAALAASLASEASVPKALQAALEQLCKYTRARLGDRTMMDALIPFIDTLDATGDAEQAIAKANEGVDGTKKMEAKLGRSTYLDESATDGVPDPGAYGLLILLQGMARA